MDGSFTIDNETVTPKIDDVQTVYVERLEKGNLIDISTSDNQEQLQYSSKYGEITKEKVEKCIKEIRRDTVAGPDKMGLKELKHLTSTQMMLILNKWWGNKIPDSAKECMTTLLPKTNEEREKLGNWRPTTIGNILMRLYAKI